MVMPRSRSMSIESRYCSRMRRGSTAPVSSRMRSDRVDLPWSTWLMMEKLRMRSMGSTGGPAYPSLWDGQRSVPVGSAHGERHGLGGGPTGRGRHAHSPGGVRTVTPLLGVTVAGVLLGIVLVDRGRFVLLWWIIMFLFIRRGRKKRLPHGWPPTRTPKARTSRPSRTGTAPSPEPGAVGSRLDRGPIQARPGADRGSVGARSRHDRARIQARSGSDPSPIRGPRAPRWESGRPAATMACLRWTALGRPGADLLPVVRRRADRATHRG